MSTLNCSKREVVFLYPNPYGVGIRRLTTINNMPLALLCLSAFLEKHGIPTRIIDTRAEDFRSYDYAKALYVGITVLTGGMIKNGLELARYVRNTRPDLPIVWGGVHPSSLPVQTVEHPLIDAVCVGEGERVALKLAQNLMSGGKMEDIAGIVTKSSGLHKQPWLNMDEIPALPYDKLNLPLYKSSTYFEFPTSRGCPHQCIFCYNQAFNKDSTLNQPSFRMQSSLHVLDQLERVAHQYPVSTVGFIEDNFFAKRSRVSEIAEGIVRKGLKFSWFANGVASYFRNYDDEFMCLLRKSGCFRIDIGGESGSPKILKKVGKGTVPEDIIHSAIKCAKNGIRCSYSFIIGWPDETDEDRDMTLAMIDRLAREAPQMWINAIYVITAFPGTAYLDEAIQKGFSPPDNLEGWAEYLFAVDAEKQTPWHDKKKRETLMTIARLSKTDFLQNSYSRPFNGRLKNIAFRLMSYDAKLRWRFRFFGFPYEWKIWDSVFRKNQKF
ncbi:MAG: B12-binding domain-containing radical SAM protein [Deltaproteobacteria bacterium]|nr:B12-binding domain-containing radical SAM protein [Deltaproteobacteria bacterium]